MPMDKQVNIAINLLDNYILKTLTKWSCHQDGNSGDRIVFISNRKGDVLITFEEGMDPKEIFRTPWEKDAVCFRASKLDKKIQLVHCMDTCYGFFCIEFKDIHGDAPYLPGQIVVSPAYKWTEGMEPVLMELLDSIYLTK